MNGQPSHEELRERDASFDACFHRVEVPRQFCRRQVGAFSFAIRNSLAGLCPMKALVRKLPRLAPTGFS